ncbi:SET domain-containing protein [Agrocybe pediades]|nr:SET domain-containing protein [Agrocybe pediades]
MGALPGEAIIFPPWPDPHPEFCNQINASVRKYLGLATFDFADHIKERTYILKSLPVSALHSCVTLLDSGVDGLVSSMTPKQVPGYSMQASTEKKFVVKETPVGSSMGLGMFALVNMPKNTLIDAEHPVIITPYVIGVHVPTAEIYQLIFGKLGMDVQMAFSELCGSRKDGKAKSDSLYESIMKANSLPVELPVLDPGDKRAELSCHRGLFLNASRINHSCSPNALWTWDLDSFTLQLRSVRHIRADEEITVAYVPPELSFQERRNLLRERYGFECHCTHCCSVEVAKSDSARLFLTQFWDDGRTRLPAFRRWCEDLSLSPDMLIEAHKQALGLIQREGLEVLNAVAPSSESSQFLRDVARHVDAVAMCYGALQDVENFRFWIKQSRGCRSVPNDVFDHGREGDSGLAALDRWLVDPSSFPAWGWRGAVKEGIVCRTSHGSLHDFVSA